MPYSDFTNEPFTDFSNAANKQAFEAALSEIQTTFGQEHPAWIGGNVRLLERGQVDKFNRRFQGFRRKK